MFLPNVIVLQDFGQLFIFAPMQFAGAEFTALAARPIYRPNATIRE